MNKLIKIIEDNPDKVIFISPNDTIFTQSTCDKQIEHDTGLNANDLIDDYFNGIRVPDVHPSGNPELETTTRISGTRYVYGEFLGDYEKALEYIINEVRP